MSEDLAVLARDLQSAALGVDPHKLVQVEALQVKRDWQSAWSGVGGLPHIGKSVTYETNLTSSGAEAEIGPDPSRTQGPLDNIVEFGSSQHGPIRPVTERLTDAAAERLATYLADQVQDIL